MEYLLLLLIPCMSFSSEWRLGVGVEKIKHSLWEQYDFEMYAKSLSISKYWDSGLGVKLSWTDGYLVEDSFGSGVEVGIVDLTRVSFHYEYELFSGHYLDVGLGHSSYKNPGMMNGRAWKDTDSDLSYSVSYRYRLSDDMLIGIGYINHYDVTKDRVYASDGREYTESIHLTVSWVF